MFVFFLQRCYFLNNFFTIAISETKISELSIERKVFRGHTFLETKISELSIERKVFRGHTFLETKIPELSIEPKVFLGTMKTM